MLQYNVKLYPFVQGVVINIAFTNVSARVEIPLGVRLVTLRSTKNCYYKFGDSSVTVSPTTGALLLSGSEYRKCGDHTYIAVIRDTVDGNLNIVEEI